jgi:PAS domain S-box-containing protein
MTELGWYEVLDALPDAVVVLDDESRIVFGNSAAQTLFDRKSADLVGEAAEDYVSARDREAVTQMRAERQESGVPVAGPRRLEISRPDGSLVPVEVRVGAVTGPDGAGLVICSLRDLSERLRAEERQRKLAAALNEAKRLEAVGQLAGGVAHDFNNLLSIVLNYADFVAQELPDSSPQQEDLAEIRRAGERGAELTRQLLIFSRRETAHPELIDLNQVLTTLERLLGRTIGEQIEMHLEPAEDLWAVEADPAQIEQAIVELAINARDAMPTGGMLTIATANVELDEAYTEGQPDLEPGPYVRVTVSDTGAGIEREALDRIFVPFYTTKPPDQARSGLGLAAVHGIIGAAGGQIAVYSELGVGTVFKIHLPATLDAERPSQAPPAAAEPATILVVEDEQAVLRVTARVLRDAGHTVLEAADGAAALEVVEAEGERIDLVLSDVIMPRVSGAELAASLAESHPRLPVVFMSGYPEEMVARRQRLAPGAALVEKPFAARALLNAVAEALDG